MHRAMSIIRRVGANARDAEQRVQRKCLNWKLKKDGMKGFGHNA